MSPPRLADTRGSLRAVLPALVLAISLPASSAAPYPQSALAPAVSYASLARLSEMAEFVMTARVLKQTSVPAERAPGLAAGMARLYLEGETLSVLAGKSDAPARFAFLADVPVDAKGRPPKLKKQELLLFARSVPGRSGELQLVSADGHMASTPDMQARLRPILASLVAAGAPPKVTGVRDVLSTEGNLAGESETQIFLATTDDRPAAITVLRRPGQPPRWGVSWSELVDQSATAPARDTLAWYRLACGLPRALPASAAISADPADKARAAADYRHVLAQLGPCDALPSGNPH